MKTVEFLLFILPLVFLACNSKKKETDFAEVNDTKLYYEVAGSGDPIVFIHGWSFDTRCWDDQFSAFARDYRVLRYDLRGFGKSALPDTGQSYSHTDDLIALLDFLGLERVHVLGHSFGGRIAIDFALNYPERTITLLLPDAAMDVTGLELSEELANWIGNTWQTGRESGIEQAKEIWIKGSPLVPAMQNPNAAKKVKQMIDDYSGWHWKNNDPYVGITPYPPERLSKIKAPTLIIVGGLNPQFYFRAAEIQKEHIPNSEMVVLPGVGHALNIENPEEFNEIVLGFLSRNKTGR